MPLGRPALLTAIVPVPSSSPQRPIRFAAAGSGLVHRRLDRGLAARDVPDPRFVHLALEEALRRAGRRHRGAERACWMLSKRGVNAPTTSSGVELAVQVQPPRRAVVRRGGVIPDVVADGRLADDRMVAAADRVLEVGGQHAGRALDAEEVVHVDVAALGFAAPFREQRYGGDAPVPRRRRRCRGRPHEPQLEGEGRRAKFGRGAERHPIVDAVELQREWTRGLRVAPGHHRRRRGPQQSIEKRQAGAPAGRRRRIDGMVGHPLSRLWPGAA